MWPQAKLLLLLWLSLCLSFLISKMGKIRENIRKYCDYAPRRKHLNYYGQLGWQEGLESGVSPNIDLILPACLFSPTTWHCRRRRGVGGTQAISRRETFIVMWHLYPKNLQRKSPKIKTRQIHNEDFKKRTKNKCESKPIKTIHSSNLVQYPKGAEGSSPVLSFLTVEPAGLLWWKLALNLVSVVFV